MWEKVIKNLKFLTSNWTQTTAVGGLVLYFFGYLVLRYRLTLYGVGTDLEVLDERYFFEGVRFFVFFITSIPNVLMIGFGISVILYPFFLILKFIFWARRFGKLRVWWSRIIMNPSHVAGSGIVLSLLSIQLIMRRCFLLNNLLMRDELPGMPILHTVLLSRGDGLEVLYFPALLVIVSLSIILMWRLKRTWNKKVKAIPFHTWILGFLIFVQVVLLPINYGIFIGTNYLPRVNLTSQPSEKEGVRSWLLWEGKNCFTYFQCDENNRERKMIAISKSEINKTEIIAYDHLLSILFEKTLKNHMIKKHSGG